MKLASMKQGRDGRLVVVSNDLAHFADTAPLPSISKHERLRLRKRFTDGLDARTRFVGHDEEAPGERGLGGAIQVHEVSRRD